MAPSTTRRQTGRRTRTAQPQRSADPNRAIAREFVNERWVRPNQVWHWTIGENGGEYVFWLDDNHWETLLAYVRQCGRETAQKIVAQTHNRHHYAAHHCLSRFERIPNVFERAAALLAPEIAQLVRKPA